MKFGKHIDKNEYQKIFKDFQNHRGYMVKLVNKNTNDIAGYLVRAELETMNNMKVIALCYHQVLPTKGDRFCKNSRFNKAVAIERCLTGGQREIVRRCKYHDWEPELISESYIKAPLEEDFSDYIEAFEEKVKNYYGKDQKILTIVA